MIFIWFLWVALHMVGKFKKLIFHNEYGPDATDPQTRASYTQLGTRHKFLVLISPPN